MSSENENLFFVFSQLNLLSSFFDQRHSRVKILHEAKYYGRCLSAAETFLVFVLTFFGEIWILAEDGLMATRGVGGDNVFILLRFGGPESLFMSCNTRQ